MGLSRLRKLDQRVAPSRLRGGFLRTRRPDEPVESHLRYLMRDGIFGTSLVAEDVLAVLDRVAALEARVAELEQRG